MSSSAALEVGTALAVRELFPYTATETGSDVPPVREATGKLPALTNEQKLVIAKICQAAENKFVGVNCGLLDQISSLFGKAAHAISIDCQSLTVGNVPMVGDIAVVVCNSNVKHALVGGEYNELRQKCEEAAKALGVQFLRSVDMETLQANKSKLTERQFQCAYHVVGENQRVAAGEKALRANDFVQFGQYMFQSHESSRDYFHNSTKELDMLVAIAREHPAILGARLTGGGFGGATINLVKRDGARAFMDFMAAEYEKRSGHKSVPMLCQIVDGAK
jgi:galactokinase